MRRENIGKARRIAENVPYDEIVRGILTATSREGMAAEEWVNLVVKQDEAIAEVIAAFEQKTGEQVELVQPTQDQIFDRAQDAIVAGSDDGTVYYFTP